MWSSILVIGAALIPFVIEQIDNWQSAKRDPKNINKEKYEAIDKQIVSGKSDTITLGGGDDLDELERLQRSRSGQR